jgi:hypothetical protein
MLATECPTQLTLWKMRRQEVTATFDGGRIVTDAGLLSVRHFEKKLGVLADLAEQLPDPRSQTMLTHSREALLTQRVYQILADYPDCNDAQSLRSDPLFQTLAEVSPDEERDLASGSTLARFHYAYTRRQAHLPAEERPVLLEQQAALNGRLKMLNEYLGELFLRTRPQQPTRVIIDVDATDDPTHGQQVLSGFHGYFEQHQYFPLLVFDGDSGFPLAAWLRPGTVHASCGIVETLRPLVAQLRAAYPNLQIQIMMRGDTGFAIPELYAFCEQENLQYAFGYASNDVLKDRTDPLLADLEEYYHWYKHVEPSVQRFENIRDYQAATWPHPRRIIAKLEINRLGTNRRFIVTNMSEPPQAVYHGFYVQRGDVPEKPIGELKNGLHADRLSAHRFRANAFRLLEHVIAYAIVVLYREAAASVPEVARAEVNTLRQKLWKVGALVKTSARRIWFHFSETWPQRDLFTRVHQAVMQCAEHLVDGRTGIPARHPLLM